MRIAVAYVGVILIWSTTPIAIQWSNSSLNFISAVGLRMILATIICLGVLVVMRKPLIEKRRDWQAFAAGSVGLFPNMLIVYWSAQFIPSGLMAIILGLFPFTVGVFSLFILRENVFTYGKVAALIIAVLGLTLIHIEQMQFGGPALYGVLGMLASCVLWGLSSVWMKAVGSDVDSFRLSTGVLVVSTPGFFFTWLLAGGSLPSSIDTRSIAGVIYLVVAGSVLGGTLFFYVLKNCKVGTVSLITLITPILAVSIGFLVEGETISPIAMIGCGLILFALTVYQGVFSNLRLFN